MQCEICNKKDAVVHFKHVADGEMRELNICEDCAAKNGLSIQPPDLLTDFLMGKGKKPTADSSDAAPVRQCLACGMKDADFNSLSRLGCSACYDVFEKDVEEIVASAQEGNRHIGKFPKGLSSAEELSGLQGMLDEAIALQNFEEAARIRDIMANAALSGAPEAQSSKSGKK